MNHFAISPRSPRFLRSLFGSAFACVCATLASAQIPTPSNTATPANTPAAQTPAATPANQAGTKFLRYIRAADGGARVRNLSDKQGLAVLEVPAGGLLAVHREQAGWYEVEVPGGFPVWVWGQYLSATSDPNVFQVTGANVNMRPLPSNSVDNFPLGVLEKNDRVRLIGRKDASKPLAEDWVNVWSRPGTRGWVAAGETQALANDADGAALWAAAVLAARPALAPGKPIESPANAADAASGELKPLSKDVTAALAEADALLAAERKNEQDGLAPDYAKPRAAYEHVLTLAPTGSTAELARERLKVCLVYSESYALRSEMERKRDTVDAAVKKLDADMERARSRGAFDGRFESRGWLERRVLPGNQPIFILRWAGDPSAELVCTSGRYDLSLFLDFELGINGREVRGPVNAATPELTRPRELDVTRIEVLAGRRSSQ